MRTTRAKSGPRSILSPRKYHLGADVAGSPGIGPFYWASGNLAEVDFVALFTDKIVPIEVKAATNVKARSLAVYRKNYQPPVSVKTSQLGLDYADGTCPGSFKR